MTLSMNQLKQQFDDQGYVVCRSFCSTRKIDEINDQLLRLISDVVPEMPPEHVFYESKSDPATLKQLQNLHEHDAYFGKLMSESPFRSLAEDLLGGEVSCKNLQYFNKPPGIGLPTPAHQDGFYFKLEPCEAVTLWLALDPVDEENGCVRYVKGSHKCGMRPHAATGTLGFSQGISDFPKQADTVTELALPAETGDLLAHHAMTIHRAEGNHSQDRNRRALGFIYYSAEAKEDIVAWERYQSELNSDLRANGKI